MTHHDNPTDPTFTMDCTFLTWLTYTNLPTDFFEIWIEDWHRTDHINFGTNPDELLYLYFICLLPDISSDFNMRIQILQKQSLLRDFSKNESFL